VPRDGFVQRLRQLLVVERMRGRIDIAMQRVAVALRQRMRCGLPAKIVFFPAARSARWRRIAPRFGCK
jgi:hypothetical protein